MCNKVPDHAAHLSGILHLVNEYDFDNAIIGICASSTITLSVTT